MADTLNFEITFHGPLRIASGRAERGLDDTIDLHDPFPASTLKGAMRAAAADLLRAPRTLISEVFGSEFTSSPWVWTRAVFDTENDTPRSVAARIVIDPDTQTVVPGLIQFGEVAEPTTGRFTVSRVAAVADASRHIALLRAAAGAVSHVGSQRRRGLGWITIRPPNPITATDLELVDGGAT